MKIIWMLLINTWISVRFDAVSSSCVFPREHIVTPISSQYGDYDYNLRTEERDYSTNIICTHINKITSPIGYCYSNCKSITFEFSNVSTVPTNAFFELQTLNVINMSDSGVDNIETGAFSGLFVVKEIYLDMNSIHKISRGAFNSLSNLEILNLSRNSIGEIEAESFHGSSSITYLDLSYNKLTAIPKDLMKSLTKLKSLNISNNLLASVNNNLCYDLFQLRYVILNNNKIMELDGCIEKLLLRKLSLSKNILSDLGNITFPNTLLDLRLDNNNISQLSENAFTNLSDLQILDLAKNSIKNTLSLNFRNMDNLKVLNISNNDIDQFDPNVFSTLQQLNILIASENNISVLQRGAFQHLSNIELFDLSRNNIDYIPLDVLSDMQNLKILNLSGNAIEYLESGVFNGLNDLRTLDISKNLLTHLRPHIFFSLTRLEILNTAYNRLISLQIADINLHCPNIKSFDIDGNRFSCNELATAVLSSKFKTFSIEQGSTTISENVNGIACFQSETSLSKQNNSGVNNIKKFFEEDFKKSSFYEFFSNFSLYKQNTENTITSNITFLDKSELKEIRNLSQSFIKEFSALVNIMKKKENHEHVIDNYTLLMSSINEFFKNETFHFHEIVKILSRIANELNTERTNTVFNISKFTKMNENMTQIDMPLDTKQYLGMKNSSLNQLLEKLIFLSAELGQHLRRNADKVSDFTAVVQEEMELFMKFENFSLRNSIHELSINSEKLKDKHESQSSNAMKFKSDSGDITETLLVNSEIDKLISALSQLKLVIILGMILLMASFSVKLYKYVETDYCQRRNRECSSLELPVMDK